MSDSQADPADGAAPDDGSAQRQIAAALGIGSYSRHILLCVGCGEGLAAGEASWTFLKARLKELEKSGAFPRGAVYRTRAKCLRICGGGPILVVLPDGVWYRKATPDVVERILIEHLGEGRVVEEYAFAFNPLFAESEETDGQAAVDP